MKQKRQIIWFFAGALILSLVVCSQIGAVSVSLSDVLDILQMKLGLGNEIPVSEPIWWGIRVPRVLFSVLVGASLAICGAAMQGLFRNPLADPSIIGISGGAALAAALGIVVLSGFSWFNAAIGSYSLLSILTFSGAVLVAAIIFRISRTRGRISVPTMLLAGIALNAIASAVIGLLTFMADEAQLRTLTFWTLGSMSGSGWNHLILLVLASGATISGLIPLGKSLNALALGEEQAEYLGVSTSKLKNRILLLTSLSVGISVAFCGMIGFVGLVVPHILRSLGFADHRLLLPLSALGGGILLCWADTLARKVVAPVELPIGIITACIGAPVFLTLIIQQKGR